MFVLVSLSSATDASAFFFLMDWSYARAIWGAVAGLMSGSVIGDSFSPPVSCSGDGSLTDLGLFLYLLDTWITDSRSDSEPGSTGSISLFLETDLRLLIVTGVMLDLQVIFVNLLEFSNALLILCSGNPKWE